MNFKHVHLAVGAMSGAEMAGEELWQECSHWLARIELITRDHVLTSENAKLMDLCRFLRDGVMICKILHILDDGSIDLRAINQRPQNAQVSFVFLAVLSWVLRLGGCEMVSLLALVLLLSG